MSSCREMDQPHTTTHAPSPNDTHGPMLPDRAPDRLWGGSGTGGSCTLCAGPVARDQTEFELEFDGLATRTFRVHAHCFTAWEAQLRHRRNGGCDHPAAAGGRGDAAADAAGRGLTTRADPGTLFRRDCGPASESAQC